MYIEKKKMSHEFLFSSYSSDPNAVLVPRPVKERKKHDRFNGMSEAEVIQRTLPDHLNENLDIVIVSVPFLPFFYNFK